MAIKATFPAGKNETVTDSLYQWDYGQVLEIESAVLGSNTVEVHFACTNMSEAIVRVCTFSEGGIVTVAIPDDCLEQSSPITAWIYEIAGTQGRTSKVIRIPVIARTRPSVGHDIPTEISDQYTQLITNVNEVIDKLENGQVSVKKAETATKADLATTAGNASTANYAVSAAKATVLGPNKLTNNGESNLVWDIDSAGVYVVLFEKPGFSTTYSAFIAVKNIGDYTRGTSVNISSVEASLHYVYDVLASDEQIGLTVYYGNDRLPIKAVYKIADI